MAYLDAKRSVFLGLFTLTKTAAQHLAGGCLRFNRRGRSVAPNASKPSPAGEETKPTAVAVLDQLVNVRSN